MFESIVISSFLGLSLGSFVNVCTYRLPRGISVVSPRSFCPNCKSQLTWMELIPIISFIITRGRCKECDHKISFSYPIVELIVAASAVFILLQYSISWKACELFLFFIFSLTVAIIDWKFLLIPNQMIIAGLAVGIVLNAITGTQELLASILSSAGAFVTFIIIMLIGNAVLKKQTMGAGDIKLAAVIGLFLGYQDFLIALWIAAIIGSIYGLFGKYLKPKSQILKPEVKLPLGSFLCLASFFILLFQQNIHELLELWLISNR